jgi:ribosomal protein L13E
MRQILGLSRNRNSARARHLGVPVDLKRSTIYPENVDRLQEWIDEAKREGFRVPRQK